MNRRDFLMLSLAANAAEASSSGTISLSLLPLYNTRGKPVPQEFIDDVRAALQKMYRVTVAICEPELYDGPCEGNAVLEYLSHRNGHLMAITSGPLHAPVRNGISAAMTNVLGWADIPSDRHERARGSVITTYGLWNLPEGDATQNLGVVAIHELGHNLGAWDCHDSGCYMNNMIHLGRGTTPKIFCNNHKELLWLYLR